MYYYIKRVCRLHFKPVVLFWWGWIGQGVPTVHAQLYSGDNENGDLSIHINLGGKVIHPFAYPSAYLATLGRVDIDNSLTVTDIFIPVPVVRFSLV